MSLNPITQLGSGITRRVSNSKYLRIGWSKGTGSGKMGKVTKNYQFIVEPWRIREWKVPDVSNCELTPYMDPDLPKEYKPEREEITNSTHFQIFNFKDYFSAENLPSEFSDFRKQRWLEEAQQWEIKENARKQELDSKRKQKMKDFYVMLRKKKKNSL